MIEISHTYAGNSIVPPPIFNRRRQGIPPGGPADPYLSVIALQLAKSNTCLEITTPITLATDEPTQIALAAPPGSQCLPNHPTASLALIPLLPGKPLTIQAPQTGFRAYLSWSGLTASTRFPKTIELNTQLPSHPTSNPQYLAFVGYFDSHAATTLSYLPIEGLYSRQSSPSPGEGRGWGGVEIACQTTPNISRIGTRLEVSPSPEERRGWGGVEELLANLVPLSRSEPSLHGAIQVTPDSQLLIHGPDGPTLGGYPKLGAIIQASFPTLAQLRPNQSIQLQETTLVEAQQSRQVFHQQLAQTLAQIDQALSIAR